jgi:oligopeptide transport system ATP-binding protein
MSQKVLLSVKNLNLGFIYGSSLVNIVKNVSFDLHEKETLVIIGESGSGKSVLSKSLGNMNEKNAIITEGSIEYFSNNKQFNLRDIYSSYIEHSYVKKIKKIYKNKLKNINNQIEEVKQFAALEIKYENMIKNPKFQKNKKLEKKLEKVKANLIQINKDIHNVSFLEKEYENINLEFLRIMESIKKYSHTTSSKLTRSIRGKEIAYIFQDPSTALNPLLTIGYQIKEVLKLHCNLRGKAANNEVINLLTKVGINDPKKAMKMLPSEYSGGMRQRIVIAIALASKPKILIADEPTTALDVTVQKQIIELLLYLKKEMNLSMIFITHDLGLASIIADNINVMYSGSFIEKGSKKDIFLNPLHPYT